MLDIYDFFVSSVSEEMIDRHLWLFYILSLSNGYNYVSIVNKVSDVLDIYDYFHNPNRYENMPQSFKRIVLDIYERWDDW